MKGPPFGSGNTVRDGGFNHRLESLRGIAALMVAVGHALLVFAGQPWDPWFYLFNGRAAVTLFFILSGYVLGLALRRTEGPVPREFARFTIRRVFRIYPAFLVVTILLAAVVWLSPVASADPLASGWFNQFYRTSPGLALLRDNFLLMSASINCVTWTLRVELVGSLVLAALHWVGRDRPWWFRAGLLGGLLAWAIASPQGAFSPYLFMFYLGYLIPMAAPACLRHWSANRGVMLTVLAIAIVVFLRSRHTRLAIWSEPFAAALLLTILVHGFPFKFYQVLDRTVVRFYGRVSYSFYLLHFPVLYLTGLACLRLCPGNFLIAWPNTSGFLLAAISILAATPLAWLLFTFVEKPGIELSKRLCGLLVSPKPPACEATLGPVLTGLATAPDPAASASPQPELGPVTHPDPLAWANK